MCMEGGRKVKLLHGCGSAHIAPWCYHIFPPENWGQILPGVKHWGEKADMKEEMEVFHCLAGL